MDKILSLPYSPGSGPTRERHTEDSRATGTVIELSSVGDLSWVLKFKVSVFSQGSENLFFFLIKKWEERCSFI